MKQLIRITCLAAIATVGILGLLFLLASCSQEEDGNVNVPATGDTPLTVSSVSISGEGTNAKTDTRASVLPTPITSGKLWVGIRGGGDYTAQTGLVYTYASGAWSTSAAAPMLSKDPISLYAYWPQDVYGIDGSGNVTLTTQPYDAAKDLGYAMSGGDNVCATHPYAGFVLNHAYARVKVDIIFSPFFEAATTLDAVSVSATGIRSSGTLNIGTWAYTPGATQSELKWTSGATLSSIDRKYIGDMLVAPSPAVTNATLTVTIGGTNWVADLGSTLSVLEAGKSYRIKVMIDPALIIAKVEVEDWTAGASYTADTEFETK